MRVVSLACSNTEIVCALGCGEMLVAVDDHSDRPAPTVARLPRVGPDLDIDVARVCALRPDLVLGSLTVPGHERVIARLQAAGVPLLVLAPSRLEEVYQDVIAIAGALGVPGRGAALAARMRAALAPRPRPASPARILVQWWPRPTIAPGGSSWVTDLMAAAGGVNPLAERPVASAPLADEEVAALAPDAIVIAWCGVKPDAYRPEVVYRNPAWQHLPALRRRRVYTVPEAFLGRPGPGLVDGFAALAAVAREAGGG